MQASLFWGACPPAPSFAWWDRDSRRSRLAASASAVASFEHAFEAGYGPGLLRGGGCHAGAIGGGVRAGLATEPPALFGRLAARFTAKAARVVIVLLVLPVALTLVLALTGAALHPHVDLVSASALIAGALVALLLLGVLAAAVAIAWRALRSAEEIA